MSYSSEDSEGERNLREALTKQANLPDEPNTESTPGRRKLRTWLNRMFRIVMTDGRILIGEFSCTDGDANVILGMCYEYTKKSGEERFLGQVMVPGRHILSMEVDVFPNSL